MKIKLSVSLLLFFSLVFNPIYAKRNRLSRRFAKLASGGQLSQSVTDENLDMNRKGNRLKKSMGTSVGKLSLSVKNDAIDCNLAEVEDVFWDDDSLHIEDIELEDLKTQVETEVPAKNDAVIKKDIPQSEDDKKIADKKLGPEPAPKKEATPPKELTQEKKEDEKPTKKEPISKAEETQIKEPREEKKEDEKPAEKEPEPKTEEPQPKEPIEKIKDVSEKTKAEEKKLKEIEDLVKGKKEKKEIVKKEEKLPVIEEEKISFNFDNVDLRNVAEYIKNVFGVTLITDDIISPTPEGKVGFAGSKITFKTNVPLTKKQAWNLFLTFVDLSGLALVPQANSKTYRIEIREKSLTSALPTYIGVSPKTLPDNDTMIRYVYFLKDCPLATITSVINELKSTNSKYIPLEDHNGFIITDNSYNIKVLMKIVTELDKVAMPQTMSVLKLNNVDVKEVIDIFNNIQDKDKNGSSLRSRLFGPKRVPTALFFPENVKIIEEPRTNSLVLLGPVNAIKKIEGFITKYIDIDVETPYSPLYVYDLKYAAATDIEKIMNDVVAFGQEQAQNGRTFSGALRGGDKYFKDMHFTAEQQQNKLIIRGDYDDYLKAKKIIDGLDEAPMQVAIEVLILNIDLSHLRELGAQIRNKFKEPCGSRVNFQTSGLYNSSNIVQNPSDPQSSSIVKGAQRLLGNLISLVGGAGPGHTLLSLGSDRYGVWGMINMLQSTGNTQIISNPFLVATNNTPAMVQVGETIRIQSQTIYSEGGTVEGKSDYPANLTVQVTPKISSDGMIQMKLDVEIDSIVQEATVVTKLTKNITTYALAADREILALGGLIRNRVVNTVTSVPILGKIPLLGWFFKNKRKDKKKEDLLILISAHIIEPNLDISSYTNRHYKEYRSTLKEYRTKAQITRDPIDVAFFRDTKGEENIAKFIFKRDKPPKEKKKKNKKNKRQKRQKNRKNKNVRNNTEDANKTNNTRKRRRRSRRKGKEEE